MPSVAGDRSRSWFEVVIDEALRAFTDAGPAADVLAEAMTRASLPRLPEDGPMLGRFLEEHLADVVARRLSPEIAEAIVMHLTPLAEAARTGSVVKGALGSDLPGEPDEPTPIRSPLARLAPARWIALATIDRLVVAAVTQAAQRRAEVAHLRTVPQLLITLASAKRRDSALVLFVDAARPSIDLGGLAPALTHLPRRSQVLLRLGSAGVDHVASMIQSSCTACVCVASTTPPALIASTCRALLLPTRP